MNNFTHFCLCAILVFGLIFAGFVWWADYKETVKEQYAKFALNTIKKCCACPAWVDRNSSFFWNNSSNLSGLNYSWLELNE